MKLIGQILVEQGWVDPAQLARALDEQPHSSRRICSLLILRGALDPDHAARALAEQHGVPGVLQKHLEHRDLTLPGVLPPALARSCVALPIGRTSSGALIVCVRDPHPEVVTAISAAIQGAVVVAVAPAYQLEHLVAETYPADPAGDELLQLEFPSQPAAFLDPAPALAPVAPEPATAPPAPPGPEPGDDDEIDIDLTTRRIPVIGNPLDDLGSMTLVGLDDARVDKDPSQSGQHDELIPRTMTGGSVLPRTTTGGYPPPRTTTGNPPPRTLTSSYPPRSAHPALSRSPTAPVAAPGPALDASIAAIEGAASPPDAIDAAMYYLAGRFHHAVWFAVHEGAALGERGHGDQLTAELIQTIAIPLSAPSILQVAHDTRRLATEAPPGAGPIQDRLWRALGAAGESAAAPIDDGARVVAVIAVGEPIGDPATAHPDLERLARALGAAFRRNPGR